MPEEGRYLAGSIGSVFLGHRTMSDIERYGRNLTAYAYPTAEELPGSPAFRRKWVLRVGVSLPAAEALAAAVKSIESDVREQISKHLGQSEPYDLSLASVSPVRLDDHHLVL